MPGSCLSRTLDVRTDSEELQRQCEHFADSAITAHLLHAIPTLLLILNRQRQIVFGNRTLLDLIGIDDEALVHGLRPGEALSCINMQSDMSGCGTSESCEACGMLASIMMSLAGRRDVRECRFMRRSKGKTEAIDLLVWSTPLEFGAETFTVFALSDISHEKRRRALERIFFHDILNVVGSIKGFSELLRDYEPEDRKDIYQVIYDAAGQLIDEIEAQRTLAAAETKELVVRPGPVVLSSFLQQLVQLYRQHEVARGLQIEVDPLSEWGLVTDRMLLARILGNMLKNALEASEEGESVSVGCVRKGERIEFRVHNRAVIPPAAQREIFQRSFSTKGIGRGLGTYSMKILSEFLEGEVSFTSDQGSGTTFRLLLPAVLKEPGSS
jgi:signal transduction histidine kinase